MTSDVVLLDGRKFAELIKRHGFTLETVARRMAEARLDRTNGPDLTAPFLGGPAPRLEDRRLAPARLGPSGAG